MAAMKNVKPREKANDVLQRKKSIKKDIKTAMKKVVKKPAAWLKKGVKTINKTKANKKKKKDKSPRFYPAAFVEGPNCEFFIQAVDAATETLCKVYYSKDYTTSQIRSGF